MVSCPSCGTKNDDRARFCTDCGASLSQTCSSCGRKLPGAVRFCPHCGTPTAPAEPSDATPERKLVTVLFADVTGSTSLGEQLDAERFRDVLDTFFAAMRDEIEREGGTVEKYIGDAVMAAFGVPVAHEDDPSRALRTAIGMQRRLTEVNRELVQVYDVELAIRIGVNTGEVMTSAGSRPEEGLVAGDAVNAAARLEQAAEPGQIVVSERTAAGARGFEFRPLGPLSVKGKRDRLHALLLRQDAGAPAPGAADRGVPGLHAPIVGRDQELDLLGTLYERATTDRRPHLVTIYGEPGVGKSRLAREFLARAQTRDPQPIVLRGRCLPYGEGVTYWPFAEILKGWAGVLDSDPPETTLTKIREAGAALLDGGAATDPERITAALAYTAGVEDPRVAFRRMEPRQVRTEIHDAWRSFFSVLAGTAPILALVEDIHWADPALLDLLQELVDRAQGRILLLCPARPELTDRRPDWGGGRRNVTGVALEPLDERTAAHLVSLLLEVDGLPGHVRTRVLERAGGNPFFLEEIVRGLIDGGSIVKDGERWAAAPDIGEVQIPDTVQGVLAARIDLLEADEKRALQCAAVIGRTFWPTPVELLLRDGRADLAPLLRRLTDRDLVVERLGSSIVDEQEYIFKHILTRDVAYETLPRSDRAHAHAAVADWIDDTVGGRRNEFAQLLAYHYERAYRGEQENPRGDPERSAVLRKKALDSLLDAADEARTRYALERAFTTVDAALSISEGPLERARALELRGLIALNDYRGDLAYGSYKEATDLVTAATPDDHETITRLCARVVEAPTRWPGSMKNEPDEKEVRPYIDLGLERAGTADSTTLVRLLASRAFAPFAFGTRRRMSDEEIAEAMDAGARAADMARRLNRPDLESAALDAMTGAGLNDGNYGALAPIIERRLRLTELLDDPWELGDIFAMAAWHLAMVGDYPAAIRRAEEGIKRAGDSAPGFEIHGLSWRAFAEFQLGRWDDVLERSLVRADAVLGERRDSPPYFAAYLYGPAAFVADARNDPAAERTRAIVSADPDTLENRSFMLSSFWAWILMRRGDLAEARDLSDVVRARPSEMLRPFVDQVHAAILAEAGAWDETGAFLDSSRAYAERSEVTGLLPHLDRLEGRATFAAGDAAGARELLIRSVDSFSALGCRWEEAVTQLSLAEAAAAAGRGAEATGAMAEAAAVFEELRSIRDLERADELAGRIG